MPEQGIALGVRHLTPTMSKHRYLVVERLRVGAVVPIIVGLVAFGGCGEEVREGLVVSPGREIHLGLLSGEKGRAQALFRLTNGGHRTIRIVAIRSSCRCARVTVSKVLLRPSESADLVVNVVATDDPGVSAAKVYVHTQGEGRAITPLLVKWEWSTWRTVPEVLVWDARSDDYAPVRDLEVWGPPETSAFALERVSCNLPFVSVDSIRKRSNGPRGEQRWVVRIRLSSHPGAEMVGMLMIAARGAPPAERQVQVLARGRTTYRAVPPSLVMSDGSGTADETAWRLLSLSPLNECEVPWITRIATPEWLLVETASSSSEVKRERQYRVRLHPGAANGFHAGVVQFQAADDGKVCVPVVAEKCYGGAIGVRKKTGGRSDVRREAP